MNKIYFSKTRPEAIIPSKRAEDAGFDIYPCFVQPQVLIRPGEIFLVPTGIATAFDSSMVLFIKERSSTGKLGMAIRMGVVDSGYRAEIFIGINNTSDKNIAISKSVEKVEIYSASVIYPYSKAIAQGVLLLLPLVETEEISHEDLLKIKSERMEGMGTSNK